MRRIAARAPTRLDFGGGWTDVPPYSAREGGAVCNIAIARYATAIVTDGDTGDPSALDGLVRAALRRSAAHDSGVQLTSDFPIAAGLGGSSAAGVALAGALAVRAGDAIDRHALAMRSRETEVEELGVPGGYQDHFAAAYGGALLLTFGDDVTVTQLPVSADFCTALSRRGILVYTGESRISGDTILAVRDAYLAGEARVVGALARMKALAAYMASAARSGDLGALAEMIGEHWSHQRILHPSITTPRIDAITDAAMRSGALGVKAMGASGGGCVLAIAADGRETELAQALAPLGERLEFEVDNDGFALLPTLASQ
ncbi:MAG: hypothetical protein V4550_06585 [Gemmatimonadota bacterium]